MERMFLVPFGDKFVGSNLDDLQIGRRPDPTDGERSNKRNAPVAAEIFKLKEEIKIETLCQTTQKLRSRMQSTFTPRLHLSRIKIMPT